MLIHMAIKEFREHLLSARFALTMGVLLLLVTAAVLALSADYRQQVDDYNRRVELHRRGLAVYALGRPAMVDRPVPVLSSLFRGLSFTIPESIELSTANPPNPAQQPDLEATESIFPKIDLSFCFGVVLSLVALLFSYDIVTAEKEQGTLKQMLANAVPRAVILFSKWLAVFATLAVMAIITLGYAVTFATLLPNSRFTARIGQRWE